MVGKIKHVRQKLHQEAVRLEAPSRAPGLELPDIGLKLTKALTVNPPREEETSDGPRTESQVSSFPSGIFSSTKITPEALVQRLKLEEPPEVPAPTPPNKDPEDKRTKTKREKMKERRERWLNKISIIKQNKERQAAEARRQATPVVGDMRPLADALPELFQLISPAVTSTAGRHRSRKNKAPMKRAEPADFSQMKQAQKRKLLETESSRFCDTVKTLSAKMNPLAEIGEQLRKRMRQEEEEGPS
ncbi:ribosome biogenesis protein SLX9 homolog [Gouania willdenowi]|uniref:Family with sequence similarity 207 member A n=1 Tax=Gouania willdenowi TaxID=441366 RepID=A0A8C5DV45_GOUWI|nr:protein FAM207A [Gouania willdenowi]